MLLDDEPRLWNEGIFSLAQCLKPWPSYELWCAYWPQKSYSGVSVVDSIGHYSALYLNTTVQTYRVWHKYGKEHFRSLEQLMAGLTQWNICLEQVDQPWHRRIGEASQILQTGPHQRWWDVKLYPNKHHQRYQMLNMMTSMFKITGDQHDCEWKFVKVLNFVFISRAKIWIEFSIRSQALSMPHHFKLQKNLMRTLEDFQSLKMLRLENSIKTWILRI